ncbi:MAG: glycoside hydrolase family 97 protein [Bacteroidetes bacterium]|nr:glycoside hydrolase family 97 protein [Bacteroidota bacterium]
MKKFVLSTFCVALFYSARSADTLSLRSPSGNIVVKIWKSAIVQYDISFQNKLILAASDIDMLLNDGRSLSANNSIRSYSCKKENAVIVSPVPEKRKNIPDVYNELTIKFKQPYQIIFRAYDDGVAYRISTSFKDSLIIKNETADFNFTENDSVYFPEVHKRDDADVFHTSFEELYEHKPLQEIADSSIAFSPVLITTNEGIKIALTESALEEYPGMFLRGTNASAMKGVFANYPLEEKMVDGEYPEMVVAKRADFIAKTKGSRDFPWRVIMIAREDKELPSNDMVYRLAPPSRIADASWVHAGKSTDEWIINTNLFDVPFKSGINTNTYKYYIDFAKRFGFDRIMMDAGWSDTKNLFSINPDINMDTIAAYAKAKGIRLSMWTLALTLNKQLDSALRQFDKWGVDFIMTDFIDRDDQETIEFYYRIAEACAAHKIMIMYHGAYPTKGFNRTFPNAITRESVLGSEYNIWSDKVSPGHDLTLPYTRMLAGPFDYEPGILNNATKAAFRTIEGYTMSQGTRCHQLAMFVVYDNPMQIFSGNPSQGLREPEFMQLLGSIPTIWDETKILDAKIAQYIITARKKNNNWFIGGMNDWAPRDFNISFDFLGEGDYLATICKDGINADRYAADYKIEKITINKKTIQPIHLAPGGGFLMKIEKQVK